MAFSSFSGPLRSGTVRQGSAANTGLVELAQTTTVSFSAMTTAPTAQNLFTLPAGSKILGFQIEVVTAISGGSVSNVGVVFGKTGSANAFMTTINTGLTSARVAQATVDAATVVAQANNIGTTDVTVTGTFTAATGDPTAGSTVVTVYYLQRAADGTVTPT
jgi:outer membrane PBP1 activator LpoA protein